MCVVHIIYIIIINGFLNFLLKYLLNLQLYRTFGFFSFVSLTFWVFILVVLHFLYHQSFVSTLNIKNDFMYKVSIHRDSHDLNSGKIFCLNGKYEERILNNTFQFIINDYVQFF